MFNRLCAYALCAFLLFTAARAGAVAWNDCGSTNTPIGSLISGRSACFDTTTATTSDILFVGNCHYFDVTFDPSIANATALAEAQLYRCLNNTVSTTTCHLMLVDTDVDGLPNNVTLNGDVLTMRSGQQYQTAQWIFVVMTISPGGTNSARTLVTCH